MAISKELEVLIEASLADGVLTAKEREVLHKKALQEGMDPDELDVIVEGRLQQMQNEIDKAKQKIRKCPSCGEIIPAMTAVCPSCGQVIDTSSPDNKALSEYMTKLESSLVKLKENGPSKYDSKVKAELESMIRQGRSMYGDNKKIAFLISEVEASIVKFDKAHKRNIILKCIIGLVIILIPIGFYAKCSHDSQVEKEQTENFKKDIKAQIDQQYNDIVNVINALPNPTMSNYDECAEKVTRISWNKIDCTGQDEVQEYQSTKRYDAEDIVNKYIERLQSLEPEYIDARTHKGTRESSYIISYSDGSNGTGYNEKNPKFVNRVHW